MAAAVEKKAAEINVAVVFSVVDHGGNTLLIQRMDEAFVSSCDISLNKAWSACSLKQGTHEITSAVQPGQSLYGLQLTNQQRIIIFGGGLPVIFNEQVIGAVGVREGANKQVISSQADSLIKISRIWADFFPANTSNQPI
ncbi:heme-binding protein [Klebsiella pneumoniae]|nr:heme-binding protein [Klebsiella pneumoniae]